MIHCSSSGRLTCCPAYRIGLSRWRLLLFCIDLRHTFWGGSNLASSRLTIFKVSSSVFEWGKICSSIASWKVNNPSNKASGNSMFRNISSVVRSSVSSESFGSFSDSSGCCFVSNASQWLFIPGKNVLLQAIFLQTHANSQMIGIASQRLPSYCRYNLI